MNLIIVVVRALRVRAWTMAVPISQTELDRPLFFFLSVGQLQINALEKQREEICSVQPYWEEEQIQKFSDHQAHLLYDGKRVRFPLQGDIISCQNCVRSLPRDKFLQWKVPSFRFFLPSAWEFQKLLVSGRGCNCHRLKYFPPARKVMLSSSLKTRCSPSLLGMMIFFFWSYHQHLTKPGPETSQVNVNSNSSFCI